jgi:hypothetical protein
MTVRLGRIGIAAAGLLAAVTLAGCGAGDDSGGSDEAAAPEFVDERGQDPAGAASGGEDELAEDGTEGAEGDDGGEAGELVDIRSIIYTGEITVRVEDVDQAAAQATGLADRYGGFVGADRRTVDDDYSVATMMLRIPSESFPAAVDDLGELGEEESRGIETEDVTTEVVDLQTRLATAEASVERTRALMEQASSLSDIVSIERELADREGELARLQARQRALEDLTTLSTITVRLLGPEAEQPEEPDSETGFLAGLGAGWNAFTTSVTVVVTVLGAVLPFLVAFGVPVAAWLWWARRRRAVSPGAAIDTPAASK